MAGAEQSDSKEMVEDAADVLDPFSSAENAADLVLDQVSSVLLSMLVPASCRTCVIAVLVSLSASLAILGQHMPLTGRSCRRAANSCMRVTSPGNPSRSRLQLPARSGLRLYTHGMSIGRTAS